MARDRREVTHGVVFVISVETGEVLDWSVKTLYCHQCQIHQNHDKKSEKYRTWYQEHSPNCTINFEGASGRSIEKLIYDLCWIWRQFVLRPSKGGMFAKVSRWKLPCKRRRMCRTHTVACGLREYKKKMRGQKLPDGKNVGVAGRLTDDVIDRMQSNYREAIRNNSEIGTMKTAIILI